LSDIAIEVKNLSKIYKLYKQPSDLLFEFLTGKNKHSEVHALKNINFEIKKGEVVGIIGSNGAGKSTLLRILTGVLDKSGGTLRVNGKISSILELGTGFHPDYTGRENIIMGGICLGMSKKQVLGKLNEIIEFSELEDVIDNKFYTYSSGMQARLTFATAISIQPELFIVDEALAAGDAYFVQKCTRKIKDICDSGATVLFVSHSSYQVVSLCKRAIWIENGMIKDIGESKDVCRKYDYECHVKSSRQQGSIKEAKQIQNEQKIDLPEKNLEKKNKQEILIEGCDILHNEYYSKGPVYIDRISFVSQDGKPISGIRTFEPFRIEVAYHSNNPDLISDIPLGLALDIERVSDKIKVAQFSSSNPKRDDDLRNNSHSTIKPAMKKGVFTVSFLLNQLLAADYIFSIGLLPGIPGSTEFYEYHHKRFRISILRTGYPSGAVFYPNVEWSHKEY